MKLYYYTLLIVIFVVNCAMGCDFYEKIEVELVDISTANVNNEGEKPFFSDEPIKKEAYAIAITCIVRETEVEDSESRPMTWSDYWDKSEQIKIITKNALNDTYSAGSDVTALFYQFKDYKIATYLMILKTAPIAGTHSFTVQMMIGDEIVMESETTPIILK